MVVSAAVVRGRAGVIARRSPGRGASASGSIRQFSVISRTATRATRRVGSVGSSLSGATNRRLLPRDFSMERLPAARAPRYLRLGVDLGLDRNKAARLTLEERIEVNLLRQQEF